MFKQKLKRFSCFLLIFLMLCTNVSCNQLPNISLSTADKEKEQTEFDSFLNEIFLDEVQSDSITLNYTLAHPENYGIHDFTPTFGTFTLDEMKKNLATSENDSAKLNEFHYDALTDEQKLIYDILKDYISVEADDEDYLLYSEVLGPTTGLQAQLPVLLAEYNFYTKQDIENYLKLLPDITNYFDQIIAFEQQKSKAGLFMGNATADNIINQCEDFVKNPKSNYLIKIFDNKIDNYEGLTDEEKNSYKASNRDSIVNKMIPAYEKLMKELKNLKGTGTNDAGLCNFKNGKNYYTKLAKAKTGSAKNVDEMDKAIDTTYNKSIGAMSLLYANDSSIIEDIENLSYPMTDPEEIVPYLKEHISTDFPALDAVNCTIKYVDKSLEDHLSPAFYLTPALDNFKENNIYINEGGSHNNMDTIFTTLAHEGYPGHLYQSVYFNQQSPKPIRSIMNFNGYSEGWGTYAELYSYDLAGLDKNVAEFSKQNMIATLCMYGKIDIGVNYHGWLLQDVKNYLTKLGISDESVAKEVYQIVIDEPANYLQYTIGYIEFMELRKKAEDALGDQFQAKEFNKFLLDIGPCQFYVLDKYLDQWLKTQQK